MTVRILTGDCRDHLPQLEPHSIDSIITDPPYGLSFMGKGWDHGVPGVLFWAEALRVLKPGGHLLAFGGTRTHHRLMVAIEDAGFEIRDCLMWLYGSGFPKSLNVALAIDKADGAVSHRGKAFRTAGAGDREDIQDANGRAGMAYTAPATDLAQQWDGWGTALKPAWEPIIMARKPLGKNTVAANVLTYGTGAINIDGCRIGDEILPEQTAGQARIGTFERTDMVTPERVGRWPANVALDEWDERVLRLRYNVPDESARTIREFYRDYGRVPELRQSHRNLSEPQGSDEVLQPDVLRGVVEREPQRREPSHVRQEAPTGLDPQDGGRATRQQSNRGSVANVERRQVSVAWLCDGGALDVDAGRTDGVRLNGNTVESSGDTGASASHGAGTGPTVGTIGDRASQERREGRQPAGESGSDRERRSQEGSSVGLAGIETAQGRKRTALGGALLVLECDVPDGWRQYFEPSGLAVPSPDSAAAMLDAQSGERIGSKPGTLYTTPRYTGNAYNGGQEGGGQKEFGYGDTGGASRFFYCAKASRSERNKGLEGMPEVTGAEMTGREPGSAGLIGDRENRGQTANPYANGAPKKQNHHPTVKPIALMRYLVRMVTPPGGTVLDPFMGSGSTLIAAEREGFNAVGIELDSEYAEIARRRITGDCPMFVEVA